MHSQYTFVSFIEIEFAEHEEALSCWPLTPVEFAARQVDLDIFWQDEIEEDVEDEGVHDDMYAYNGVSRSDF